MNEIIVALISSLTTFFMFFLRNRFVKKRESLSNDIFWSFIKRNKIKELKIKLKTEGEKFHKSNASKNQEAKISSRLLNLSIPDEALIRMIPEEHESIKQFLRRVEGRNK